MEMESKCCRCCYIVNGHYAFFSLLAIPFALDRSIARMFSTLYNLPKTDSIDYFDAGKFIRK